MSKISFSDLLKSGNFRNKASYMNVTQTNKTAIELGRLHGKEAKVPTIILSWLGSSTTLLQLDT